MTGNTREFFIQRPTSCRRVSIVRTDTVKSLTSASVHFLLFLSLGWLKACKIRERGKKNWRTSAKQVKFHHTSICGSLLVLSTPPKRKERKKCCSAPQDTTHNLVCKCGNTKRKKETFFILLFINLQNLIWFVLNEDTRGFCHVKAARF